MKNFLFSLLFITTFSNAQMFYRPLPNFVNSNSEKGTLSLMASGNFSTYGGQLSYNISNDYQVFGMYFKSAGEISTQNLFGDNRFYDFNKSGYSFGLVKSINKLNKQMGIIVGFEMHENEFLQTKTYYYNEYNDFEFHQIFGQFNYLFFKTRSELGFSAKLSFFKYTKHLTNNELNFENLSTFTFSPTFIYNYNLTKDKKLKICTQTGLSTFLKPITAEKRLSNNEFSSYSSESQFHIGIIFNVGLKYDFLTIKN